MKINLEVLSLETTGDAIRVTAQGKTKRDAQWQPWRKWVFDVPLSVGLKYRIGQILHTEMQP